MEAKQTVSKSKLKKQMGTNESEASGPENTHRDEHGVVCASVEYDTVQLKLGERC